MIRLSFNIDLVILLFITSFNNLLLFKSLVLIHLSTFIFYFNKLVGESLKKSD